MNLQLRKSALLNEIYAVWGYLDGFFICYCLNDDEHFNADKDFILKHTRPVRENVPELLEYVSRRYPDSDLKNVYSLQAIINKCKIINQRTR